MKQTRTLVPVFLLFVILYLSCNKTETPDPKKPYVPEYITATVSGRVTDDAGKPVIGALVKAGSASATTDVDGAFTIADVSIDKQAAFIKVEKEGFFLGTKTFVATAGKNNPTAIRLIKKTLAGNITGSGGGTVTVPSNGGVIDFEANSVINPAGNTAYTGTVAVHAFFINPEASDFADIMPGTLRGITTANEETGLQSYSMMAVELTGAGGEKLQLAPGKNATLHFPIPASLQAEAPATIPLWSLDENTGLWKEEGKASRKGNEYIGMVSHFSYWSGNGPFPVIEFTGIIRNQQGNNVDGAKVVISMTLGNSTIPGSGFTNGDGVITGKIPANKTLQLKIYNKCGTLLLTQNIGPFATTADLGVITVNSSTSQVTFSGSVKNCFNEPVTNGFVTVKLDDIYNNIPVTNGSFSKTITRCSNSSVTATLTAFDATKQQTGPEVNIAVSGNTVNAGTLVACGSTADTYIRYTLNGVGYQLQPPADTLYFHPPPSGTVAGVFGIRQGKQYEDLVFMWTGPLAPGIHPLFNIEILHGGYNPIYYKHGDVNVDLSEYATTSGGYVSGAFSGTVRDSAGATFPINCSFRVKRP
jgi:hypothetical protein